MKLPTAAVVGLVVVVILVVSYTTGWIGAILDTGEKLAFTTDFTTAPVSGQNHTVEFNVSVSGGLAPFSFFWTFGDGTFARGSSVTHTYDTAGTFSVELLVVDSTGISRIVTKSVVVA